MVRRASRRWLVFLVAGVVLCLAGGAGAAEKLMVYIGGRGRVKGGAIYRCRMDLATGALTAPEVAAELPNPSFLAFHPNGRFLYSVIEAGRFAGTRGGGVAAFAIRPASGELTPLNRKPSGGTSPCHIVVDRRGKHVLGANYGGGSVFVLPIGPDGRLGERTALVQHKGRGADPKRQRAPHAHAINLDAANRFALSADLGLDKILVYRFDAAKGTLSPHDPPFAAVAPGAGPRHLAMHPSGKWAYVITEMASTVAAYAYDADKGTLTSMQTVSTLPKGFAGTNYCAEVEVHRSGKFLYGSNRGHDSIAIFAVDPETGRLGKLRHASTRGKHPRHFRIDPTGRYLLVANRDTNEVVVFGIDAKTGGLKATGHTAKVPGPACVKLLPPK